jgi:hypothetical protein
VRRIWELLILLIILAVVIQAMLEFILPLIPYMAIAVLALLLGGGIYYKKRSW